MAEAGQHSRNKGNDQSDGGGCLQRAIGEQAAAIHERDQDNDGRQADGGQLHGHESGEATEKSREGKCPNPYIFLRPLALQANQQTDSQRDRNFDCNLEGREDHSGNGTPKADPGKGRAMTQSMTPGTSGQHVLNGRMRRPLRVFFRRNDLSVAHVDDAVAIFGSLGVVRNHQDGLA